MTEKINEIVFTKFKEVERARFRDLKGFLPDIQEDVLEQSVYELLREGRLDRIPKAQGRGQFYYVYVVHYGFPTTKEDHDTQSPFREMNNKVVKINIRNRKKKIRLLESLICESHYKLLLYDILQDYGAGE